MKSGSSVKRSNDKVIVDTWISRNARQFGQEIKLTFPDQLASEKELKQFVLNLKKKF